MYYRLTCSQKGCFTERSLAEVDTCPVCYHRLLPSDSVKVAETADLEALAATEQALRLAGVDVSLTSLAALVPVDGEISPMYFEDEAIPSTPDV